MAFRPRWALESSSWTPNGGECVIRMSSARPWRLRLRSRDGTSRGRTRVRLLLRVLIDRIRPVANAAAQARQQHALVLGSPQIEIDAASGVAPGQVRAVGGIVVAGHVEHGHVQ